MRRGWPAVLGKICFQDRAKLIDWFSVYFWSGGDTYIRTIIPRMSLALPGFFLRFIDSLGCYLGAANLVNGMQLQHSATAAFEVTHSS